MKTCGFQNTKATYLFKNKSNKTYGYQLRIDENNFLKNALFRKASNYFKITETQPLPT